MFFSFLRPKRFDCGTFPLICRPFAAHLLFTAPPATSPTPVGLLLQRLQGAIGLPEVMAVMRCAGEMERAP